MQASDLTQYQWQNRLLLVLCEHKENKLYQQQIAMLLNQETALKDRKLKIFTTIKTCESTQPSENNNHEIWQNIPSLLQKYSKSTDGFEVLLIGLDGGIKIRQTQLISMKQLCGIIDRMPMRRAELKRKKQN